MSSIFYGGTDAFSGICPTPYLALSQESDGFWASDTTITLEGEIFLCGTSGLAGALAKKNQLSDNFKQNFRDFKVYEGGAPIFGADIAVVKKIDFQDSNYAYNIPFSIELSLFDSGYFSGRYGVVEPENSFNISQDDADNYAYSISHKISAKGKSSAVGGSINNAKNWVRSQTGLAEFPYPALFAMHNYQQPILLSQTENINRMNGQYSISESYTFDQAFSGYGMLRYTSDISLNKNGFNTVSVEGSLSCGPAGSFSSIESRYSELDLWSVACEAYSGVFGKVDLYSTPVNISVEQSRDKGNIDFSVEYNNDTSPDIVVISTSTYRESYSPEENEDSASISAVVRCTRGPFSERYARAKAYPFNAIGQFALDMQTLGKNYNYSQFKQKSTANAHSPKDGSVTYSVSWGVTKSNAVLPCYIKELDYTVTKTYPLRQYDLKQPLCDAWNAYYRHFSQTIISIAGSVKYEAAYKNDTELFVANIAQNYRFGMSNLTKKSASHSDILNSTSTMSFSYEFDNAVVFSS